MHRAMILAFAALALAACGPAETTKAPAPPTQPVAFDIQIEVGRYGAMLSQIHEITNPEGVVTPDSDPSEPKAIARALRETVWEYNLERSRLCARGVLATASCGPTYNPIWLADPVDADVGLEELQTRANALGDEVMPFWTAVCEDAESRVPDEEKQTVCPME